MPLPALHLRLVQAIVKIVNAPDLPLPRALRARGNLGKALLICTDCRANARAL